jgi:hypothetical protein
MAHDVTTLEPDLQETFETLTGQLLILLGRKYGIFIPL